MSCRFNRLVA